MEPKYTLDPGAIQAAALSGIRVLVVLVTGFMSLLPIIGRADLTALETYIASAAGLGFITAIVGVVTFAYHLYASWQNRVKAVSAIVKPGSVTLTRRPPANVLHLAPWTVFVALGFALLVGGCATVNSPSNIAKVQEAISAWELAVDGAHVYEASAFADPTISARLDAAILAGNAVVASAQTYVACEQGGGQNCVVVSAADLLAEIAAIQVNTSHLQTIPRPALTAPTVQRQ